MNSSTWGRLGLVVVAALIAQVAVLDQIELLGVHADLMVLLASTAGLVAGAQRGAICGFVVGLVADLPVATTYGLSALTFVLVGFTVGTLRSIPARRDSAGAQLLTLVVASVLGTLGYLLLGALIGQVGMLGPSTPGTLLIVAFGALVLGIPVLHLLDWVFSDASQTFDVAAVPRGGSASG